MREHWVRFSHAGSEHFGTLEGHSVRVWSGDMFGERKASDRLISRADIALLAPVRPGKVLALWNNFHALAAKQGLAAPAEPLYFIKSPNSYLDPGATIRKPAREGKVVFEGELAIVIGRRCRQLAPGEALEAVFGYTCVNDVTHAEILNSDPSFAQWTRAKGFDTFCPLGPAIATGLDAHQLRVVTRLNGEVRQDYPISDMRFPVEELVSRISADMTLEAGDVILCGTSLGVGSMKPGSLIEIEIAGIGTLSNRFE